MTPRAKITVTLVLLALLSSLGAADYYLSGSEYAASLTDTADDEALAENNAENVTATDRPAGGVAKAEAPRVEDIAKQAGLETQQSNDQNLLAQVAANGPTVQSVVLLLEGDRIGSVTWIESAKVKTLFIALKEALIAAFSPALQDLKDETVQGDGKPTRNLLMFLDPALSEERIVFIRVRERLYEFHIAAGKEPSMNEFIETLTAR